MSIQALGTAVFHSFGGLPDKRLPAGLWFGSVSGTGDATAGQVQLQLVIEGASGPGGLIYGIKRLSSRRGSVIAENASLQYDNFTPRERQTVTAPLFALEALATETLSTSEVVTVPWPKDGHDIIGMRNAALASAAALLVVWPTNTDTVPFEMVAEGYYWLKEANLLPGGPQLPDVATIPVPSEPGVSGFYDNLRSGGFRGLPIRKGGKAGFHRKAADGSWSFVPRDPSFGIQTAGPRSLGL